MPDTLSLAGGAVPSEDAAIAALTFGDGSLPAHKIIAFDAPILNQGDVPCCVGIAIATAMEMIDGRKTGHAPLSPLFSYYFSRPDPTSLDDIQPAQGLRSAIVHGICRQILHAEPFLPAGALVAPSDAARLDARYHRIAMLTPEVPALRKVSPIADVDQWKTPIASGLPVIFGFWATPEYFSLHAGTVVHPDPQTVQQDLGHACVAFGYADDVNGGVILVRDSRGVLFGDHGCWQLPYHLLASDIMHEAWVITAISYDT